jgi:hypothetical protein|tara:strand:+ start:3630 stop:3767 length:138 start_codon:yes stop_codon:yes gene_type:complete
MCPSLIINKDKIEARMLQDGARRNNSLAPKGLGQEEKKAQLQALC